MPKILCLGVMHPKNPSTTEWIGIETGRTTKGRNAESKKNEPIMMKGIGHKAFASVSSGHVRGSIRSRASKSGTTKLGCSRSRGRSYLQSLKETRGLKIKSPF